MKWRSRQIALQGVGFGSRRLALQGLPADREVLQPPKGRPGGRMVGLHFTLPRPDAVARRRKREEILWVMP